MKYNEQNKPLVCMQTQSTCYKGTRTMSIKGVLWHSTGANNPSLKRYVQPSDNAADRAEMLSLLGVNGNKNDWNHITRQAGLNSWIGKLADDTVATVQTMPWNYRPWGCGSGSKGSCNNGWIQFEICEDGLNDASYFNKVYIEACEITAYLCKLYGIDPLGTADNNGVKVPTILCHADSHRLGLGSNHGDVLNWFPKFGKNMDTVRADVAALLKTAAAEQPGESDKTPAETQPAADPERTVWDTLYAAIGNGYGAAGLMGNLYAESGLNPKNLQNNGNKALGLSDDEFTTAVDSGAYVADTFIHDGYGYGLAQWTFHTRKQAFLEHMKAAGKSVGDLAAQLEFLLKEIKGYSAVWKVLTTAKSVREASDAVLTGYEKPADQGTAVQEKRAAFGQTYFSKYAGAPATTAVTGFLYRVRKSWTDTRSQKGAFKILDNAKRCADANPGYSVYDADGNLIYPAETEAPAAETPAETEPAAPAVKVPFLVRVSISDLNIRKGPGTDCDKTGRYTGKGVFTIVEVQPGQGSTVGWGRLKSGAGWISLDYGKKLS